MEHPIQTLIGPVDCGHDTTFDQDGTKHVRPWFRLGDRRYPFDNHDQPLELLRHLYEQMSLDKLRSEAKASR